MIRYYVMAYAYNTALCAEGDTIGARNATCPRLGWGAGGRGRRAAQPWREAAPVGGGG